ncbi:MAG TPA: hypothetical protein VEQ65_03190 [Opitutus sp.]|nr:hypothetical protein [Opitutus sp.]
MKIFASWGGRFVAGAVLSWIGAGEPVAAVVTGDALEVGSNVAHASGAVYDQLLMTGATATVGVDPGQVLRISFVDTDDDIVQVEFAGKGSLMLTLEGASGPAAAGKYNQPGVRYMKGHARLQISGSDETTHLSIFAVGSATAGNQGIFRAAETYDGIADLSEIEIRADPGSLTGSTFGGMRLGNVNLWARQGRTGIYAPNVHVQGPVRLGDLMSFETARPVLRFGSLSQFGALLLAGGSLVQPGGRLIEVEYRFRIELHAGATSMGVAIPASSPYRSYWHLTGPDGDGLLWAVP